MQTKFFVAILALLSAALADIQISDPLFRENALCDYLIVCADDQGILRQAARLAQTKLEKGLKTRIVNVAAVTSTVEGIDTPHKIRNFLKQAYADWGITWVLLMGDLKNLPAREVSTGGLYFPYDTSSVASDVYYACLDGEWDSDNDGIYGNEQSKTSYSVRCSFDPDDNTYSCTTSVSDDIGLDLWYDVYIGRLPASNGEEARIMVDKTLAYRNTPRPSTYADDMIFLAAQVQDLWSSYAEGVRVDDATYYWHYKVKPYFDAAASFASVSIDERFEDRVLEDGRAVDDSIEITYDQMNDYLSRGYNMVFYTFHGNPRGIRICSMTDDGTHKPDYDYGYVRTLRSPFCSNIMSISCSVMKMIPDSQFCFAKSFLVNPGGGACSYAGSSGIDYFNIRGRHFQRAIEYLCTKKISHISRAYQLANVKEFCRHNMFVHQYWGDPELELWTRSTTRADSFAIDVDLVEGSYVVRLTPALDSVLVCLYKEDDVFMRGYTSNGTVTFDAVNASMEGIKVTATLQNYLPSHLTMNSMAVVARPNDARNACASPVAVATAGARTRITFANASGPLNAKLVTLSGRVVDEFNTNEHNAEWRIDCLPSGVYLIKARIAAASFTTKFMIRR
jgi:hypothetical protein